MHRQSADGPGFRPPQGPKPQPPTPRAGTETAAADPHAPLPTAAELLLQQLEGESAGDRRRLLRTLGVALAIHLAVLLFVVVPETEDKVYDIGGPKAVFVMEPVRFEEPPAPKQETRREIPKEKVKRIPIPDPTPDDPEPLEIDDEITLPEPELLVAQEGAPFGIPDAPEVGVTSLVGGRFTGQAYELGAGITPPKPILQPQPRYTEDARQSRIQGVVILSAVIDAEGQVRNLKLVKGLPLGLSESAFETVAGWTYEPALKDGQPVAVNYHFTIGFWLQ